MHSASFSFLKCIESRKNFLFLSIIIPRPVLQADCGLGDLSAMSHNSALSALSALSDPSVSALSYNSALVNSDLLPDVETAALSLSEWVAQGRMGRDRFMRVANQEQQGRRALEEQEVIGRLVVETSYPWSSQNVPVTPQSTLTLREQVLKSRQQQMNSEGAGVMCEPRLGLRDQASWPSNVRGGPPFKPSWFQKVT